jgi:hypothetical protein
MPLTGGNPAYLAWIAAETVAAVAADDAPGDSE